MTNQHDFDQRKLLSALCHGSIFLSSVVISVAIPIVILFVTDDPNQPYRYPFIFRLV
ncbi:MAG: hypothetical protein RIC07_31775 [Coleofasciculus sp. E1-EBD-02]